MNRYIGTKLIAAQPMTRGAYNKLPGWIMPPDEDPMDDGYLVEYLDGGKPNLAGFQGYVSWSPKEQFDNAYRPCSAMTFGLAIEALKAGKRVARFGWNGKGMWLKMVGMDDWIICHLRSAMPKNFRGQILPWIGMCTASGDFVPWLASQTDMLAEDWQIVE